MDSGKKRFGEIYTQEKPRTEFHIRAGYCGQMMQFDILDMGPATPKFNDGFRYLANFIDVYSRFAWVQPLKLKSDLKAALPNVLDRIRATNPKNVEYVYKVRVESGKQEKGTRTPYPEAIYSDKEAVASAVEFKQELDRQGIEWVTITPGDKLPLQMIERFNLSIRTLIAEYKDKKGTNTFMDRMTEIVGRYNSGKNANMSNSRPYDVYMKGKEYKDKRVDLKPRFAIGDYVRVRQLENIFDKKSWKEKFSRQVYQVVGNASPFRFTIQKVNSDEAEKESYKPEQMKKINYDPETEEEKPMKAEEEMKQAKAEIKQKRFINKEGLENPEEQVVTGKRKRKENKL